MGLTKGGPSLKSLSTTALMNHNISEQIRSNYYLNYIIYGNSYLAKYYNKDRNIITMQVYL